MSSDQVKIDATSNANIIMGGINAALDGNKAIDKFGKMIQEATERGVQNGIEQGIKNAAPKEVKVKAKINPEISKELKEGFGLKIKLTPKEETSVRTAVKQLSRFVEKEFDYMPKASYDSVKKLLPKLTKKEVDSVTTKANAYRKKMIESGAPISDEEYESAKLNFQKIHQVRVAIEKIESTIDSEINGVKFNNSSVRSVTKNVKKLYTLKSVLNDLNKPGVAQDTSRRTLDAQDQEKKKNLLETRIENIVDNILIDSGFYRFVQSSNSAGKLNTNMLGDIKKKYSQLTNNDAKKAQRKLEEEQSDKEKYQELYIDAFKEYAKKRDEYEKNPRNVANRLQALSNNKNKKIVYDLNDGPKKTFIGHYFAYKASGKDFSLVDYDHVFDSWIQDLLSEENIDNKLIIPYVKAAEEVFSLSREELNNRLSEIENGTFKVSGIDTKPIEKSEEKIREEVKKTDKVIEDSNKKREKVKKSNDIPNSTQISKPEKTPSQIDSKSNEQQPINQNQSTYDKLQAQNFVTKNKTEAKRQLETAYAEILKYPGEGLDGNLYTYYGTIAADVYLKAYGEALSKQIANIQKYEYFENDDFIGLSKKEDGIYGWEDELVSVQKRLKLFASVYDQIANIDKKLLKPGNIEDISNELNIVVTDAIKLNDIITDELYNGTLSGNTKDDLSKRLSNSIISQNLLNSLIETRTGVKNAIDIIPKFDIDKLFDPKRDTYNKENDIEIFALENKKKEAEKIIESNNAIVDSEERLAETKKKTSEKINNKKSAVKSKQEESKAIIDANKKEEESEKKLADTKEKTIKQKDKIQESNSKKKSESQKQSPTPTLAPQPSELKPIEQAKDLADALKEVADAANKADESVGKLDDKTKSVGKTAEKTQKNVKKENEQFKNTQEQATAAATAKLDFDSANQKVAEGADKSTKNIKKEHKELEGISESDVLNKLCEYDKLTTVENGSGDVTSYTGVTTKRTDTAYETTTQKYKANEDGDFELAYTSIVEDVKKLKSENSKNEEKVRKANDKLDRFINNIDLQMGGKINAMQLQGYSGLKHISSIDEIDGLVKKMQDLDSERKRIFDSSKTNRKDLFGINGLSFEVNGIISSFNQLKNPTNELSDSIAKMIDARDKLDSASGIYEQAEAAGILRDCINESNIALKEQQRIEKDNQKSSDAKKKDEILAYKKLISGQELDEYEKKLQNTSKLSDDVKSRIANLRTDLSKASSNTDIALFNNMFKALKNTVKTTPVDSNNFQNNWDKWLSIIDRNNASQNFGNINLPNENNSAFNDIDAISEYITNKVKQATNLSKNISKLQNDLSKEISRPTDQQNTQIIEDLKENIKFDKKSLESIISNDLFKGKDKFISKDISNAYRDAELNLRKSSDNLKNTEDNQKIKKPIIEQYDAAIQKIKELKAAQDELFNLQQKNAINPFDDYSSEIDKAKEKVNLLKTEVDSFYKSDFISKNANIIGEDKVKAYQKLYDDTVLNSDKHNNDLVDAMLNAYDKMRTAENKALNLSGRKDSNVLGADIEQQIIKMEGYRTSFEKLKNEVTEVYGETFQKDAIKDLEYYWNNKTNDSLMSNNNTLFKELDNFSNKIKSFGSLANQARNDIASIQQELGKTTSSYNGDPLKYYEDMMNVRQKAVSTMSFWKDGLGGKALNVESQLSELQKLENVVGKIPSYQANLNSFGEALHNILTGYNDKSISKENAVKKLEELSNKIKEFSKNSSAFDKVNKKGTLISGTEGIVSNSKDVVAGLKEYAAQMQLGKEISTKINTTSGTVTMQFEGQNGAVTTLTGSIEAYNNALRVLNTQQSGAASSMKTFTGSLKSIAGGTMKDILGMFSSYFSGYKIMSTMMNQIQQGFTTLKAYDDSMTTISYTMNMTQSQLDSLGSSAIDMAKDLSMSLDNAMSIYQIYANMNTTAQEIQETAKPTAILSNLSGVDTATAADQVQGILQQFNMLEDGSVSAADASMHVVDVLDKISSNVAIDYAKGIKVISDAVQASGQVAYDAGMSYEQLAAVSAKVAERTREDGGTIGNAIKTIVTRISKVGKMPQYSSDVSNEELSNASKSLHEVGIEVYNTDGSFRELDTILGELSAKWDTLSDAQQSNISYNVAATRQSSKFKNILTAWTDAMDLATEATNSQGNALANQAKYEESFTGKTTAIKTQMDEFWLSFYDSQGTKAILDFVLDLTEGFTNLAQAIGPVKTLFMSIVGLSLGKNTLKTAFSFLFGGSAFKNAVGQPNPGCYSRYN